jgi:translation elongation factor EF-Ts
MRGIYALLNQKAFVVEPDVTVGQAVAGMLAYTITGFARLEVGGIKLKKEDFRS